MRRPILTTAIALAFSMPPAALLLPAGTVEALAQESSLAAEYHDLVVALPSTQLTLAQGIEQVAGAEMPSEAKFEMEDGELMLSVYTSEKGIGTIAEENVFKEYKGPSEGSTWSPETEVFEDFEHIARSAQYHTLLSMTDVTLPEIIATASANGSQVFSVKEKVRDGKPVFEVLSVENGDVKETLYDLITGEPI